MKFIKTKKTKTKTQTLSLIYQADSIWETWLIKIVSYRMSTLYQNQFPIIIIHL